MDLQGDFFLAKTALEEVRRTWTNELLSLSAAKAGKEGEGQVSAASQPKAPLAKSTAVGPASCGVFVVMFPRSPMLSTLLIARVQGPVSASRGLHSAARCSAFRDNPHSASGSLIPLAWIVALPPTTMESFPM